MIQATNAHIRRLFSEKVQAEEELQECKERIKNSIQKVIDQRKYLKRIFHFPTSLTGQTISQVESFACPSSILYSNVDIAR